MKAIKVNHLEALGACPMYVQKFKELFPVEEFPNGVEPTAERCVANAGTFDFYWAGASLLTSESNFSQRCNEQRRETNAEFTRRIDLFNTANDASLAAWTAKWAVVDRFQNDTAQAELQEIGTLRADAVNALARPPFDAPARLFAELFADDANVRADFDELGAYVESQFVAVDPNAVVSTHVGDLSN